MDRRLWWVIPLPLAAVGLLAAGIWPTHQAPSPFGCETSGVPDACNTGAQTVHHYLAWTLGGLLLGVVLTLVLSSRARKR